MQPRALETVIAGPCIPSAAAGGSVNVQDCAGILSAVYNGVGDYTLTIRPGIAVGNMCFIATPRANYAASGLTTVHTTQPTANTIHVTIGQEQAAGAASAAANVDFNLIGIRQNGIGV